MASRKIERVCMELIKPLSPTPNHLRCFKFSFLDQMAHPMSVHFALFYPPPCDGNQVKEVNSSRLLVWKKSLSKTLGRFYPFAGRIMGNSIECSDDGVPFHEAFAHNYRLEDVIKHTHIDHIQFLPTLDDQHESMPHIPLLVQVTFFECGGMSIGIRASHKIADLATLCTLINAWTVTARNCVDVPEFVAAAKFLPHPIPSNSQSNWSDTIETVKEYLGNELETNIFFFDASTIASLKAKAVCDTVPTPTRVDVVSAVVWKCFMKGVESKKKSSRLVYNVNIRKRLTPPLPNHCVGNVVAVATARKGEDDGYDLPTLVTSIRKGLSELSSKYVDKSRQDEAILAIPQESINIGLAYLKSEIDLYVSSWCGYQIFEIDFGWGKPLWVSPIVQPKKNLIVLMDSRESGGVDAWVCLMEKEMKAFQHEILDVLAIECAK